VTLLKLLCNPIEKLVVILMPVKFEATLVKWGNSVGFALPKPIRDGLELNAGDKIIIVVDNEKVYIEKIK
jgi:AbrB family looped-hinge helix DNA binding protein